LRLGSSSRGKRRKGEWGGGKSGRTRTTPVERGVRRVLRFAKEKKGKFEGRNWGQEGVQKGILCAHPRKIFLVVISGGRSSMKEEHRGGGGGGVAQRWGFELPIKRRWAKKLSTKRKWNGLSVFLGKKKEHREV